MHKETNLKLKSNMKTLALVSIPALINFMRKFFLESAKCIVILLIVAGFFSCDKQSFFERSSQIVLLDNTFGQNGRTLIPNTSEISFLDSDTHGNIIAVGYTLIGGGKSYLTIAKTNADGIIDESFGNNGLVKVTDYDNSSPIGMKITNDNKIIVIGSFTKVQFQGSETIIMRFNENGTVDENFGNNGKVDLSFNTGYIMSLNFDNDDFMLIAKQEGETIEKNGTLYYIHTGYSITKYNYEGQIDKTFGEDGIVFFSNNETMSIAPYRMKILKNGSIIIAGTYNVWPNIELGFCKLTPTGKLNTDFANGGVWHMNVMQDFDLDHEYFSNVLEDSSGNLIFSGSGLQNSLGWGNRAFLSKFSSNGILDKSFGKNGFYCFDFGDSNKPIFQIGNKYMTAGWYNNDSHRLISINNDGSYGNYVYTSEIYYFQNMIPQGNNKIILGGGYRIDNSYNAYFALERVIVD